MIRILFVCHGNICRSTMAEFVFRDMVEKQGIGSQFVIASAATSTEELGNPVHPGTRRKLRENGISSDGKFAVQMKRTDYDRYDYIIGMDQQNIRNILRIIRTDPEEKVYRLLDFTGQTRDIDDPWYTGDFDSTYEDVYEGCCALLDTLRKSPEMDD